MQSLPIMVRKSAKEFAAIKISFPVFKKTLSLFSLASQLRIQLLLGTGRKNIVKLTKNAKINVENPT
jgi:hypothetical protein